MKSIFIKSTSLNVLSVYETVIELLALETMIELLSQSFGRFSEA